MKISRAPLAGILAASLLAITPLYCQAATNKIADLEAQVKQNPQSSADRMTLGWAYLENNMKDRAEIEFRAASALDPSSQDAYASIASLYKDRRNYTEALSYYRKALAAETKKAGNETAALSNMTWPVNYISYGWMLMEAGQTDSAIAMFKSAVKALPNAPDGYQALSSAYSTQNKQTEAMKWFQQGLSVMAAKKGSEKAVLSDMNSPLNYANLGMLYSNLGQFPQAIENLAQAVKLQPSNKDLMCSLALAHLNAGHKPEYLENMKKALAIAIKEKGSEKAALSDFNSQVNYVTIGKAYQQAGEQEKAAKYLMEAATIQPGNLELLTFITEIYRAQNKPEALDWAQKALALKSKEKGGEKAALSDLKTPPNYVYMGDIYLLAKQYSKAIGMYQNAIKLEPNNSLHYRSVSNCYAAQARYDEALEWIKKAILVELKQGKP